MPSEEEIEAFRQRIHCCVPFLLLSIAPFVAIYGFCVPEAGRAANEILESLMEVLKSARQVKKCEFCVCNFENQ
jgi:hypothetical protein